MDQYYKQQWVSAWERVSFPRLSCTVAPSEPNNPPPTPSTSRPLHPIPPHPQSPLYGTAVPSVLQLDTYVAELGESLDEFERIHLGSYTGYGSARQPPEDNGLRQLWDSPATLVRF